MRNTKTIKGVWFRYAVSIGGHQSSLKISTEEYQEIRKLKFLQIGTHIREQIGQNYETEISEPIQYFPTVRSIKQWELSLNEK